MNVTTHDWQILGYMLVMFLGFAGFPLWSTFMARNGRRRRHAR